MRLFGFLVGVGFFAAPAHACLPSDTHAEKYEDGKIAARVLNVIEEVGFPTGDGKSLEGDVYFKIFLVKRADVPGIVRLYFHKTDKAAFGSCMYDKLRPLKEMPWSSVHSGLIEYLSGTLKARYLALPER